MTLRELLIKHEGWRNKPYLCSAGFWTIGVGHNFDANPLPKDMADYLEQNGRITDEMVEQLLRDDIQVAISDCKRLYPEFDSFSENRRNALVDFLFNVGYKTAKTFVRTNNAVNSADWTLAAAYMAHSLWYAQVGSRAITITSMISEG